MFLYQEVSLIPDLTRLSQFVFQRFYQLIKEWPPHLYDNESIITAILRRIDSEKDPEVLLQSLGQL